ncbi:MAG: type VI secretion system ATPase TssH, partial [Fusobacteriaceae bacterium]
SFILQDPELSLETRGKVMEIMKNQFKPEFLNRIDDIITFKSLGFESIKEIVKTLLKGVSEKLKNQSIQISFSEEVIQYLAENSYDPAYGARPLRRYIQKEIETSLARDIISGKIRERDTVKASMKEEKIEFEIAHRKISSD